MNPRCRAIAEVIAGAAALLVCVATSAEQPEIEGAEPDPTGVTTDPGEDIEQDPTVAHVVLHNGRGVDSVVRLRRLAGAVDVDCGSILSDPGALLSESLLGATESWTIPGGDNLALNSTPGRGCEVIRLESDGAAPRWLVWGVGEFSTEYLPDVEPEGEGVIRLLSDGEGVRFEGSETLLFVPDDPARGLEQCAPVPDGQRLAWGDPLPTGGVLLDASWGPDGCGAVVLSDDGETPSSPWFVCVPKPSWPFVAGDALTVRPLFGTGLDSVEVTSLNSDGVISARMQAFRASDPPTVEGLTMTYESDEDCGFDVESSCGTVAQVGTLVLQTAELREVRVSAGESVSVTLPETSLETTVAVLAAQDRVALDPECALGPDVLGPDLAIVMTQTEVEGE